MIIPELLSQLLAFPEFFSEGAFYLQDMSVMSAPLTVFFHTCEFEEFPTESREECLKRTINAELSYWQNLLRRYEFVPDEMLKMFFPDSDQLSEHQILSAQKLWTEIRESKGFEGDHRSELEKILDAPLHDLIYRKSHMILPDEDHRFQELISAAAMQNVRNKQIKEARTKLDLLDPEKIAEAASELYPESESILQWGNIVENAALDLFRDMTEQLIERDFGQRSNFEIKTADLAAAIKILSQHQKTNAFMRAGAKLSSVWTSSTEKKLRGQTIADRTLFTLQTLEALAELIEDERQNTQLRIKAAEATMQKMDAFQKLLKIYKSELGAQKPRLIREEKANHQARFNADSLEASYEPEFVMERTVDRRAQALGDTIEVCVNAYATLNHIVRDAKNLEELSDAYQRSIPGYYKQIVALAAIDQRKRVQAGEVLAAMLGEIIPVREASDRLHEDVKAAQFSIQTGQPLMIADQHPVALIEDRRDLTSG